MKSRFQKVLFLPKWYPSRTDPQNGVFIQKHAKAVSLYTGVAVLYAEKDEQAAQPVEVHQTNEQRFPEVRVYYNPPLKAVPLLGRLASIYFYIKALKQGYSSLQSHWGTPDLCHVHVLTRPAWLAYRLLRKYGIPYLVSEHWSGYHRGVFGASGWLKKKLTRWLLRKAAAVTTVSEVLSEDMQGNGLQQQYTVIPNVVEFPEKTNGQQHEHKGCTFLTIGDLNDGIKNISGIIAAFSTLCKEKDDCTLHIVGGGYDEQRLLDKARATGLLNKQLFMHGRLPHAEVMQWIDKTDVYITNSYYETFSVTTLEALAQEKPVICTRCGGPESFWKEDYGIMLPPGDQEALLNAMRQISTTYPTYSLQQEAAAIREQYSFKQVGQQFVQLYNSL